MIYIVNYGLGNLNSIRNIIKKIGGESKIIDDVNEVKNAKKLILPGIGSFDHGMKFLNEKGTDSKFLKIAQISDIHLKLDYNKWSPDDYCGSPIDTNQTDTSQAAFLGRNGCDPPKELLNYILSIMKINT